MRLPSLDGLKDVRWLGRESAQPSGRDISVDRTCLEFHVEARRGARWKSCVEDALLLLYPAVFVSQMIDTPTPYYVFDRVNE